jgi:hypothetical protein
VRARRCLVGSRPASTVAVVEKTYRVVVVPHFEGVPMSDLKPRDVPVRVRRLHQPLGLAGELLKTLPCG